MATRFYCTNGIVVNNNKMVKSDNQENILKDVVDRLIKQGYVKDTTAIEHINWFTHKHNINATITFSGDYTTTIKFPNNDFDKKQHF